MTAKSKLILFFLGLFFLTSCTRTLVPAPPNGFGCFDQIDLAGVKAVINKHVDMSKNRDLLYIKRNNFSTIEPMVYDDFIMMAFIHLGYFKKIVTAEPTVYINVESPVIEEIDGCPWYNEEDPYSIRQLRARYGDHFIIAQATLREYEPSTGYLSKHISFELQFIDSWDGAVIAEFSKQGTGYFGLDLSVVNPVLNAARNWLICQTPIHLPAQHSTNEDEMTWNN